MKNEFMGFLSKTLNLENEQLAELLYKKSDDGTLTDELTENALDTLLSLDAERVSKLKPDTKGIFDNGYRKAQAEVSQAWEKRIREKFGVDADLQGDAILDAIASKHAEPGKQKEVKTHPEYIALEQQMRKALEEKEAEMSAQIEAVKSGFVKEQTWSQVQKSIRENVLGLNPVLPGDKAKADRMLDLFIAGNFSDLDYQPTDDGNFVPIRGGERVVNAHGHAKMLADLVKEKAADYFDFAAQPPAGNAGNKNGAGGGASIRFDSDEDYYKARAQAVGDPQKLKALADAYKAQAQN